jgi:hypothetical protein
VKVATLAPQVTQDPLAQEVLKVTQVLKEIRETPAQQAQEVLKVMGAQLVTPVILVQLDKPAELEQLVLKGQQVTLVQLVQLVFKEQQVTLVRKAQLEQLGL